MSGWSIDELEQMLPDAPLPQAHNGVRHILEAEPAEIPEGLPLALAERIGEDIGEDRSCQHYALVAAALDAGYSAAQIVAMVRAHKPSVSKWADPDAETYRSLGHLGWSEPEEAPEEEKATEDAGPSGSLEQLIAALRSYLHLTDTAHVLFALAVAVSSRLKLGEALWGMVVGTPSSGKTETIRFLDDVADEHPDEITAPSLLSWSKGKEAKTMGILSRIPSPALLTVADFSTVLATSDRGGRDQLFALLRRVYDGRVQRDLGQSARALKWEGRLTLLAAVTPRIDAFSSHTDALGPRWLFCRVAGQDAKTKRSTGRRALKAGQLEAYRTQVRSLATQVVNTAAERLEDVGLSEEAEVALVDFAIVCCYGRAGVERSGYGRREILGLAEVEEPPRVASQLGLLARSLLAMGLDESHALALCRRCALDSMPQDRRAVLVVLATAGPGVVSAVARMAGCHRHVARFALEDLAAIGIVRWDGKDDDRDDDDTFKPSSWSLTGEDAEVVRRVVSDEIDACGPGTKSW